MDFRLRAKGALGVALCLTLAAPAAAGQTADKTADQVDTITESPLASAERVALNFIAENPPGELKWNWGEGVGLYGIQRFARTGVASAGALRKYLLDYHRHHAEKGLPEINYPDRCPPALSALALAQDDGEPGALASALKVALYIRDEERNSLGAIDHLGSVWFRHFYPRSIWVDSLMMYGVFAARWGQFTDDEELIDFALSQPAIFADKLQDPETGLFRHAWLVKKEKPLPKSETFWLRGNGWVAASLVELLERTPEGHPERESMIAILRKQIDGAMKFVRADGLWETVMNRPGYSYVETSGSALLGYAMARAAKRGYIDHAYLEKAWHTFFGLRGHLREVEHGYSLGGVSWFTNPSSALLYKMVPVKRDLPYGVGAYLLLAAELSDEIQ